MPIDTSIIDETKPAAGAAYTANVRANEAATKQLLDELDVNKREEGVDIPQSEITGLVGDLAGKAPTVHNHAIEDVTGLQGALDGKSDTSHVHAASVVTYVNTTSGLAAAEVQAAIDEVDANVDTNTSAIDGKAPTVHTHVIDDTTGLQSALDGKSPTGHQHVIADTTGLQSALDGKSDTNHIHAASAVTFNNATSGLSATDVQGAIDEVDANVDANSSALDGKSNVGHGHIIADTTGLQTALDGKAPTVHSHSISQVTGLQAELDGKLKIDGSNEMDNGYVPTSDLHVVTKGYGDANYLDAAGAVKTQHHNILINSDFRINQRNFDGNWAGLSDNIYGYDRWKKSGANIIQVVEPDVISPSVNYVLSWLGGGSATVFGAPVDSGVPFALGVGIVGQNVSVVVPNGSTEIKLERGDIATPYEVPDIAIEWQRCRRYFRVYGDRTKADNSYCVLSGNNTNSSNGILDDVSDMRISPVMTVVGSNGDFYTPSGGGSINIADVVFYDYGSMLSIYVETAGISGINNAYTLWSGAIGNCIEANAEI